MEGQVKVNPPSPKYVELLATFSKIGPGRRKSDMLNMASLTSLLDDAMHRGAITDVEKKELAGKIKIWIGRTRQEILEENVGGKRAPELVLTPHGNESWDKIVEHSKAILEAPPPEKKTAMYYYNLLSSLNVLLANKNTTKPEQHRTEIDEKMKFLHSIVAAERNKEIEKVEAVRPLLEGIGEYVRLEAKGLGLNVQG